MMQIVDLLYPNKYQAEPAVFKQADLTGFDRSLGSFLENVSLTDHNAKQ